MLEEDEEEANQITIRLQVVGRRICCPFGRLVTRPSDNNIHMSGLACLQSEVDGSPEQSQA